ncbi:MAG: MerR family transcriptional regulator [Anaerolineales bacterium]|nr:MerR family transcriptional regulator [Anaerolineales bacterium]
MSASDSTNTQSTQIINGSEEIDRKMPLVEQPTFNLKAVVNETGLKPDTLRAWERRYGLPDPERTSGGHRLYSQQDIDMLKWLVERQDEGLSISRAIKLWRRLLKAGRNPLTDEEFTASSVEEAPALVAPISKGNAVEQFRHDWIEACMKFDEQKAERLLSQAFALFPIETVCYEVLQRGLSEVGMGWYEGEISVQQEHFASALAIRRLETLVSSTPPPTRNGRILATCPPEERHTFGLLLLTLFLRRSGWDVVYLGGNVPTDRLSATVAAAKPHLVILSAQTLYTAATMLPMSLLLQRERIASAYGGAVFNQLPVLRAHMPGYYLGTTIENVPKVVEQLLTSPPPMPTYKVAPREYQVALDHYRTRQASIEAKVWQLLEKAEAQTYLKNANKDLAKNIIAALTFGDMELLSTNMEWVKGLLVNYHYRMPEETMQTYIGAYYQACTIYMDERGRPIINWLKQILEEDA